MYKPFIEKAKEIKIDSPTAIESIEQTLINITEGEKPVIIEQVQPIQPTKVTPVQTPEKLSPKKGFSAKKCLVNTKTDSSSDSSDSDSSCSCGSNCSCTTSSSGSSSSSSDSDSSSSEGRRKLELKKVLKQERRDRVKSENANLSSDNIDVVNTDKPDEQKVTNDADSVIFESDLETDESETDEDFYDEHPQRLANQLLAEKRKQLMMQTCLSPMNSFDIIENSRPSTPSLPEEMIKEKKVKVKKRKKDRKSSKNVPTLKLNIPLKLIEPSPLEVNTNVNATIPSFNVSNVDANKVKLSIVASKANKTNTPGVLNKSNNVSRLSTGSSCSDIETPLKRSQRKRIPNKFYGYHSDEESSDMMSNPFKPTPPPNLTWRKEDLPQTPTVVRTPPIKTVIKLPPTTNFKLTQPDHHPPAQLFESKPFISPKPLPPHKLFPSTVQPPPIPPIIIRPNRIQQQQQQQPPRVEPLRVPAVPVHHIAATQISQDSEQSADSTDSESDSDDQQRTLQISQPTPVVIQPTKPVTTAGAAATQQTIPFNFQSNQIRYPIMPPAGCRPAREGESVYCYCRCPYDEVSEMIACDGSNCAIEWFHFECVNIMVPPKGTWYCPECRPKYINESQPMYEGIT